MMASWQLAETLRQQERRGKPKPVKRIFWRAVPTVGGCADVSAANEHLRRRRTDRVAASPRDI